MSGYNEAYELMKEIYNNFSDEDKEWFRTEEMHIALGRHLRNHAHLWEYPWEPELVNGVDYSKNHPDAVSNQVIRDFQESIRE